MTYYSNTMESVKIERKNGEGSELLAVLGKYAEEVCKIGSSKITVDGQAISDDFATKIANANIVEAVFEFDGSTDFGFVFWQEVLGNDKNAENVAEYKCVEYCDFDENEITCMTFGKGGFKAGEYGKNADIKSVDSWFSYNFSVILESNDKNFKIPENVIATAKDLATRYGLLNAEIDSTQINLTDSLEISTNDINELKNALNIFADFAKTSCCDFTYFTSFASTNTLATMKFQMTDNEFEDVYCVL